MTEPIPDTRPPTACDPDSVDFETEKDLYRDIHATFATDSGRRVLAWIKEFCGVGATPYAKGDHDHTVFLVGRQDPGNRIAFMADTPLAVLIERAEGRQEETLRQRVQFEEEFPARGKNDFPFDR